MKANCQFTLFRTVFLWFLLQTEHNLKDVKSLNNEVQSQLDRLHFVQWMGS